MTRRPWLLAAALLLAAPAAFGLDRLGRRLFPPRFHATAYVPPQPAADFSLTAHDGRTVRLRDLRGKVVLLFFGYTTCPDICPITLSTLRQTVDSVGVGPDRVRILLVTVDPALDTPAALAAYVSRFGPTVTGLTGPPETLRSLYAAYGVGATVDPGAHDHRVMHTSGVYGIDRRGEIRVLLRPDVPPEELEDDLRTLLDA